MYILTVTEEQLKSLLSLLDRELKVEGINSLAKVVELHNVLASAVEVVAKSKPEPESPPPVEPQNETP